MLSRNPEKLCRQLERSMRDNGIEYNVRQSGSHRTYQADKGNVVVSMHGEIPKGTFRSILKMALRIGIIMVGLTIFRPGWFDEVIRFLARL